MKNLKNQKGITLVALVVTIIVLLILAGVSLRLVAGDEGILKRSEEAVNRTESSSKQEKVDLALANAKLAWYEDKYDGAKDFSDFVMFMRAVANDSTLTSATLLNDEEVVSVRDDITKAAGVENITDVLTPATDKVTVTVGERTKIINSNEVPTDWTK